MPDRPSVCCPVCGAWFYRKPGSRQKYDKELCRKTAERVAGNRRRKRNLPGLVTP